MASWTDATRAPGPARAPGATRVPPPDGRVAQPDGRVAQPDLPARGLLRPELVGAVFRLGRYPAAAGVDDYVEHYWAVEWDLPSERAQPSDVLSHPALHLTVEDADPPQHGVAMPAALVHGVLTRRFEITLRGSGRVVGARFRPGALTALTGVPAHPLSDRVVPAGDLWPGADALRDEVLATLRDEDRCALLDAFLAARLPSTPDPRYATAREVVAHVMADRGLTRVDHVAAAHGLTVRTLQRLTREHVGVSATWLIRRGRLQDAVADLQSDPRRDLGELAVRLGWYDQAHLTRDFTAAVGVSPARYARGLRTAAGEDA
jgi:AraC-like DNA-binding protein